MSNVPESSNGPTTVVLDTNERANLDTLEQSKDTHMMIEYLTASPLYRALTHYDPRIPSSLLHTVYISNTIQVKNDRRILQFIIEGEMKQLDRDTFVHKILGLEDSQEPVFYPQTDDFRRMLSDMGAKYVPSSDARPVRGTLPPPWNFLYGLITGCLFGQVGPANRCSIASQEIMYGIFYDVNTDIGTIIWNDFLSYISNRMHKGALEIHHARYWTIIIATFYESGFTKPRRLPMRKYEDIKVKSKHHIHNPESFRHPIMLPKHIVQAVDPKSPALAYYNKYITIQSNPVEKTKKRRGAADSTKHNPK